VFCVQFPGQRRHGGFSFFFFFFNPPNSKGPSLLWGSGSPSLFSKPMRKRRAERYGSFPHLQPRIFFFFLEASLRHIEVAAVPLHRGCADMVPPLHSSRPFDLRGNLCQDIPTSGHRFAFFLGLPSSRSNCRALRFATGVAPAQLPWSFSESPFQALTRYPADVNQVSSSGLVLSLRCLLDTFFFFFPVGGSLSL